MQHSVKRGQEGVTWPNFEISGTPSISRERLELETSYLASRFITRGTNDKNAKLGQKGQEGVTWPTLEIFGPPPYLLNGSYQFKSNLFAIVKMHNKQFIKITFQLAGQTSDSYALCLPIKTKNKRKIKTNCNVHTNTNQQRAIRPLRRDERVITQQLRTFLD